MPWTGDGYGSAELDEVLADEKRSLQQVIRVLQSLVAKDPYTVLGYLGTETNMMALDDKGAVEAIGQREGFMNTKRSWYIDAKEKGKTIWTATYVDANTQDLIITCATPAYGSGEKMVGVVGYDVLLSTIEKDILSLDIGYKGYAMLVDRDGKVLVRPGMDRSDIRWDATYQTENLTETPSPSFNAIAKRIIVGESGVERYETGGEGKYIAYAPLFGIGASLAIVINVDDVIGPAFAIQNYIAGVFIVVLIISILIGLLIGNNITKPIKELTLQANQISSGLRDLETLEENRKDEIGILTQAFNRLVTSLQMAISRL
jgi:methyl-accepting chemotaxis protein